jgi:hypothetical protein
MKFKAYLNEAMVSKDNILITLNKDVNDKIVNKLTSLLYDYLDTSKLKKSDKPYIYRSQPSKKIIDELWYRTGVGIEKKSLLDKMQLDTLKRNFYKFSNDADRIYKYDADEDRWNFIG